MGFWTRLWDGIDRTVTAIVGGDDDAYNKRRKKRRRKRKAKPRDFDPERDIDQYAPGDEPETEYGYARGYNAEIDADVTVVAWTGRGGLKDWYSIAEGDVPTRSDVENADLLTIAVTYPDGAVDYRTFKGPTADIRRIIDDWIRVGSL